MARLAISKDYFPAYAALPRKAQRKADEFLKKFESDSTALSIHLEPIKNTLDPQLRSARIGDDYRVILRAPDQGDVFLVLWADHHDEAYRWAATKQTAIHPATGTLQIFDAIKAGQAVDTIVLPPPLDFSAEAPRLPTLFFDRTDDELFLAGVPKPLLPSVRSLLSDGDVDLLLPHLPPEAAEVLTGIAAGLGLDEALEEVFGRVSPPIGAPQPIAPDVLDVPAALERETTQRQFRLLGEDLDLDAALQHPLDVWRVFLHPRQKRVAHARTKGPVRVLGGAGTGKTVVALHRAAFLVREVYKKPDDRVLFTTFTVNLAEDLRSQLAKLLEPDDLARVEVVNIDSWAAKYVRDRGRSFRPAFETDQKTHFNAACEIYGQDDISRDFYWAEWRDVVQEQDLRTIEDYLLAVRKRRGVPLSRAARRKVWPVFQAYRTALGDDGFLEPVDILRAACVELATAAAPPRYRAVVVDEAQDFSADGLKLVRAIAGPEHPDDLFLVGDAHQRIYGRPVSLSACGIQVRGRRSQTLRLNYRTTGAICRYATRVLEGLEIDDLDDGRADERGYVSLREGPAPAVRCLPDDRSEETAVVETVRDVMANGTPAESICVVARTRGPLNDRFGPALSRAGIPHLLLEQHETRAPGVRLATMHRVKGLEFAVTLLVDVSKGSLPAPSAEIRSDDPMVAAAALARERALVYVAASRARDDLFIFASGALSPLIAALPVRRRPDSKPAPARTPAPQLGSSPPPAIAQSEAQLLTTPLSALQLPTRMLTWAARANVRTLGDLVRHDPRGLAAEQNLGRTSINQTRQEIQRITRKNWEELVGGEAFTNDPTETDAERFAAAVAAEHWDRLRGSLNEEQRAYRLAELDLPARVVTYAEKAKLETLADLANKSRAELEAQSNLGRTSIRELIHAIGGHAERLRTDEELAETGLLESFRSIVQALPSVLRTIMTRRSGLAGDPETLQEVGASLGFTRERARQLQAKASADMARRPWATHVRKHVDAALHVGAVSLETLRSDAWWYGATQTPEVARFVVEDVLDSGHVIVLDDAPWLSSHPQGVVDAAGQQIRREADALALPCAVESARSVVARVGQPLGAALEAELWRDLEDRLQIDGGRVVAIGTDQRAEVLAILRASAEPMRLEEVFAKAGRRVRVPEEAILFKRGTIGLRQHFPDFDDWAKRLVPRAEAIVEQQDPDRQWSCAEILDELREEQDIPEWLSPWGLAALIRAGSKLQYLGRLRVALPGNPENESRIFIHEEVERLLTEAGAPMTREDLVARVHERAATTELGLIQIFMRPQFVRLDGQHYGLLDRDVPGGPAAVSEALDHIEAVLRRRDRGLSLHHLLEQATSLGPEHASWTRELLHSLLRSDGRFRLSQSAAVGLAEWESTRVPTRLMLVRSALDEAEGRVSIEALMDRIEANYGEKPTRAGVAQLASHIGAGLDGEWMYRRSADSS